MKSSGSNSKNQEDIDKLVLAQEYLDLAEKHPTKLKTVIFHIRRMCKDELTEYQVECLWFYLFSSSFLTSILNVW